MHTINKHVREGLLVQACEYVDLYKYCPMFNLKTFGPVLHVKLPELVYRDFRLFTIYNVDNKDEITTYKYEELNLAWVDIMVDLLDLSIGLHTYKLEFVNCITGDTYYQYFNYVIQDDEPEKPYIYMDR